MNRSLNILVMVSIELLQWEITYIRLRRYFSLSETSPPGPLFSDSLVCSAATTASPCSSDPLTPDTVWDNVDDAADNVESVCSFKKKKKKEQIYINKKQLKKKKKWSNIYWR